MNNTRPCRRCIAGVRFNRRGEAVRCDHRPRFYRILHPVAVALAALRDLLAEAHDA